MNQHIVKMNNDVKTYNTSTSFVEKCPLKANNYSGRNNVSIYDIMDVRNSSNIIYDYNSKIKNYDAFLDILAYSKSQADIDILGATIGIYKDAALWPSGMMMGPSPITVIKSSLADTLYDTVYKAVLEIPKGYQISSPAHLVFGYEVMNIKVLSTDVILLPLIENIDIPCKYAVYYQLRHVRPHEKALYILYVTKDLTDAVQLNPNNPVISTELPVSVPDIERASLLHNTEIFINRISTY